MAEAPKFDYKNFSNEMFPLATFIKSQQLASLQHISLCCSEVKEHFFTCHFFRWRFGFDSQDGLQAEKMNEIFYEESSAPASILLGETNSC